MQTPLSSCFPEPQSVVFQPPTTHLYPQLQVTSRMYGIIPTSIDQHQLLRDPGAPQDCIDSQEQLPTFGAPIESQEWSTELAELNPQICVNQQSSQFQVGQCSISQNTFQNRFSINEAYQGSSTCMAQSSTPKLMAQFDNTPQSQDVVQLIAPQDMVQYDTPQHTAPCSTSEHIGQSCTPQHFTQSITSVPAFNTQQMAQCALEQGTNLGTLDQRTHFGLPHQKAYCGALQNLVQQNMPQDAHSCSQQEMGHCSTQGETQLSSPLQIGSGSSPELKAGSCLSLVVQRSTLQQEFQSNTQCVNSFSMQQKPLTSSGTPTKNKNKTNVPKVEQKKDPTKKKSSTNTTKTRCTADSSSLEPKQVKRPRLMSTTVPALERDKAPSELENPQENELKLHIYYQSTEMFSAIKNNRDGYLMYYQRPWQFEKSVNVTNIEFPELSKVELRHPMTKNQASAVSEELLPALAKGIHIFCNDSGDIYAHRFCKSRIFCYSTVKNEGFQHVENAAYQPIREPRHTRYVRTLPKDKMVKVFDKSIFVEELKLAIETDVLPEVPTVYFTFSQPWEAGFPISNCLVYMIVKPQHARFQRKYLNKGKEESFKCNETNLMTSLSTLSIN